MSEKDPINLGTLQANLAKAISDWKLAETSASRARSEETAALNRMNQAQKALDAALTKLREEAPRGSEWQMSKHRGPTKIARALEE